MAVNTLRRLRSRATHQEGAYLAWPKNLWGIELEVADFLWGLVRALRPELVLESGTGRGISTRFLAYACKENNHGRVVTFEPDPSIAAAARPLFRLLPVELRDGNTLGWDGPTPDLVFLDSFPPSVRAAEMTYWLAQPVLLAIHDANRYDLPAGLEFPTPRGMWFGRGGR